MDYSTIKERFDKIKEIRYKEGFFHFINGSSIIGILILALPFFLIGWGMLEAGIFYFLIYLAVIGFGIYFFIVLLPRLLKKMNSKKPLLPLEEMKKQLINEYFEPERTVIQQEKIKEHNRKVRSNWTVAAGAILGGTGGAMLASEMVGNISSGINKSITYEQIKKMEKWTSRGISDAEFDEIFKEYAVELNLRQRGIEKLGLDETQITELTPLCLESYYLDKDLLIARRDDGIDRTSAYSVTWLFFTSTQLCIYRYVFDMLSGAKKEYTEQYFWKHITKLATSSIPLGLTGNEQHCFVAKTAGGDYECTYMDTHETKRAIHGMMAYWRTKNEV